MIYTANITQEDSNPEITIGENTLGNIEWTKTSQGIYKGTLAGAFSDPKKAHLFISNSISPVQHISLQHNDEDSVIIETKVFQNGTWIPSDWVLSNTSIKIIVYP